MRWPQAALIESGGRGVESVLPLELSFLYLFGLWLTVRLLSSAYVVRHPINRDNF